MMKNGVLSAMPGILFDGVADHPDSVLVTVQEDFFLITVGNLSGPVHSVRGRVVHGKIQVEEFKADF